MQDNDDRASDVRKGPRQPLEKSETTDEALHNASKDTSPKIRVVRRVSANLNRLRRQKQKSLKGENGGFPARSESWQHTCVTSAASASPARVVFTYT